ncbi:hypothetical protein JCM3775_000493 [Rhodotorula graminis]
MAAHQPPVFVLPRADLAPSSSSPNSRTSPGHSTANALSQATDSLSLAELALPVPPPIPSTSRLQRAPTPPPPPAAELPQDASKPAKTKRGRKRIAEPLDNIKDNPALDAEAKRKLQNRAAQRAFRERKEKHTADLEERVKVQEAQLDAFKEILRRLLAENEALRAGANPPRTAVTVDLTAPSAPDHDLTPAPVDTTTNVPGPTHTTSPEDVKPAVSRTPTSGPTDPNPSPSHFTPVSTSQPPPPVAQPLDTVAPPHAPASVPTAAPLVDTAMPAFDDLNFDFDAPFDFSDSIALPPLFTSMIDGADAAGSGVAPGPAQPGAPPRAHDAYDDDACPGDDDDDEPPALPEGGIPCAECDFSQQSCSLPIPWRPPTVSDEKNLWLAQKCWAKLLSHPLFSQVDPDDLCAELRARTRCSTDGRLVCHKSDVCDVFRSIPQKAKLRAQALSMR